MCRHVLVPPGDMLKEQAGSALLRGATSDSTLKEEVPSHMSIKVLSGSVSPALAKCLNTSWLGVFRAFALCVYALVCIRSWRSRAQVF